MTTAQLQAMFDDYFAQWKAETGCRCAWRPPPLNRRARRMLETKGSLPTYCEHERGCIAGHEHWFTVTKNA